MAPPSPRRSSRARPTAPPSQHSSSTSSTSGRLERSTRSVNKPSSGKSTPSASLSSEPLDDLDDTLLGRRRKRGQDDEPDRPLAENIDMVLGSEDLQDEEEDEAVRCICGSEDYPGPPPADAPEADYFLAHELTDDVTGFFVQCDICKVWQHGACVGIFSAEASPDEYFCEQCRKEYHRILIAPDGQRYSKYLPLQQRASRATSLAGSIVKEGTKSPKSTSSKTRAESAHAAAKRRSTMNSRDAAYDDEQLRRAIEASKEETALDTVEDGPRRPKRGRSDSEENLSQTKRQRTSSRSASPVELPEAPSRLESDDESAIRNGPKKPRNGRFQREQEEKEDRERVRQEAASKRKGRAERRRAEGKSLDNPQTTCPNSRLDSDLSEEVPLAVSKVPIASVEPPTVVELPPSITSQPSSIPTSNPASQPTPGTPPTAHPITGSSHKKGARSNHKKSKGKNQYTKEREGDIDESPVRSMSRDIQKTEELAVPVLPKPTPVEHSKPPSKAKSHMTTKMSMTDMRRRVGAIMDFISRTQVDLAAEATPSNSGTSSAGPQSPQKASPAQTNGFAGKMPDGGGANGAPSDLSDDKEFKELNCMEMMDVLTRDMVKWQNQYT